MNIPFSKVHICGKELEYVGQVFKSGWLTTAGRALELEARFGRVVGAGYAYRGHILNIKNRRRNPKYLVQGILPDFGRRQCGGFIRLP